MDPNDLAALRGAIGLFVLGVWWLRRRERGRERLDAERYTCVLGKDVRPLEGVRRKDES